MAKLGNTVRLSLQQAAVQLFQERGFDRTTAAEIAERAGVTERTFFRHFPDKREVLFDGQTVLGDALMASIASAPSDLRPLEILFRAFRSVSKLLEENRPFSMPRHAVIAATPALQERELTKLEALAETLAAALRTRDIPDVRATLAARVGIAAFAHATIAWLEDGSLSLGTRFDRAELELKSLL